MKKISKSSFKIDVLAATFFSGLFNPFVVFILAFTVAYYPEIHLIPGAFIFFICLMFFPTFFFYLEQVYTRKKHYADVVTLNRDERHVVYLFGIFSGLFNTVIFSNLQLVFWTNISMLITIIIASIYLINKYIDKASMHAFFFSLALMMLIDKINTAYGIFFVVLPIVFWSRITLHKHTWLQLYLGTVLGLAMGLIIWMF